ncbi:hypothetical protein [Actinomadura sp. DC4]|nr:hypothetical protein [Actinomadura sp. DC4]MDN3351340.1 hypothetical protein [Actinomadura sp. DC4]
MAGVLDRDAATEIDQYPADEIERLRGAVVNDVVRTRSSTAGFPPGGHP